MQNPGPRPLGLTRAARTTPIRRVLEAVVDLAPVTYVMVCFSPPDGQPPYKG